MHTHILFRAGQRPDKTASLIVQKYHSGNVKPAFMPSPSFMMTSMTIEPASVDTMSQELSDAGFAFFLLPLTGGGFSKEFLQFIDPTAVGTVPPSSHPITKEQRLASLKQKLRAAVESESFETASAIQVEIDSLTSEA